MRPQPTLRPTSRTNSGHAARERRRTARFYPSFAPTRAPRRLALLLPLLAALGCRKEQPPPGGIALAPAPEPPIDTARRDPDIQREIQAARLAASTILPRNAPAQRFVFLHDALVVLWDSELTAYAPTTGEVRASIALDDPRRLVALADGSLLVLARAHTERIVLAPRHRRRWPKIVTFAQSAVLADRAHPDRLWITPATGNALYRYDLPNGPANPAGPANPTGPVLTPTHILELPHAPNGPLFSFKDGSLGYLTHDALHRRDPLGKTRTFSLPEPHSPRFILPARRLDRVWLLDSAAILLLAELRRDLHPIRRRELARTPFDADSTDRGIALVSVSQTPGARDFRLDVFDETLAPVLSAPLPTDPIPTHERDLVAAAVRNQNIVFSPHGPFLAIGGPDRVCLFTLDSPNPRCLRPPSASAPPATHASPSPSTPPAPSTPAAPSTSP